MDPTLLIMHFNIIGFLFPWSHFMFFQTAQSQFAKQAFNYKCMVSSLKPTKL